MATACLHCDRKDPPSTGKGEGRHWSYKSREKGTLQLARTHLLPAHHWRSLGREGSGSAGQQPPPQRASSPAPSPAVVCWLLPGEKAEGQSASLRSSMSILYSHWHASMSSPPSEGVGLSRPCSCRLADTSLSAMLLTSFSTSSSCTCDSLGRAESATGRPDSETHSGLSSALPPLGWPRWAMLCVASGHMDRSITTL